MLKVSTVTAGIKEKEAYYVQDESLTKQNKSAKVVERSNIEEKLTTAVWFGKGAEKLGLVGAIAKSDFQQVFYGYQPRSTERIRQTKVHQAGRERLAYDLTLSASKSTSMVLHLGLDTQRIFDANLDAVKEVLTELESRYAQTRIQSHGKREIVNTNNLLIALIPHHTSRDNDMQVHVHALVMNGTFTSDGQWRSLYSKDLCQQQWVGDYYRNLLAQKLERLGYDTYQTKTGFEIKGIAPENIKIFSKRSQAIADHLKKANRQYNAKNRNLAVLTTRKAKNERMDWQQLRTKWQQEVKTAGIPTPIFPQTQSKKFQSDRINSQLLDSAIAHLSERKASFSKEDIYKYIFSRNRYVSLKELDSKISRHLELVPLNDKKKPCFTTVAALRREISTVGQWMEGQNVSAPLLEKPNLDKTILNDGQREVIARILTSTDIHQIIDGLSGVGKTTALSVLKEQLIGNNICIKGFAPTIDAASRLEEELKIPTQTVQKLALSKQMGVAEQQPQLWVVDEAGLVGADIMEKILSKAKTANARIILVGDKRQNSSILAGNPLRSLIDSGATTHNLHQIIRQQNSLQKQAVELIAGGDGEAALNLLDYNGYVTEIADRQLRAQAIAEQYLRLSPSERDKTLLVAGTNKERLAITKQIRIGLREANELGNSIKLVQLKAKHLTNEQSKQIKSYQIGDYLKLNLEYKTCPLKKGKLYRVEGFKDGELSVSSLGGRIYHFNPAKFSTKQVFTTEEIEVAVGDRMRWTDTDRNQQRTNGKQFTVISVKSNELEIQDDKGLKQKIELDRPVPLDYNLVKTSYRAQGQSKKRVIVSATNDPTSSTEPFYVKISRQKQELSIYTENKAKLAQWIKNSNAQKNPLDLINLNYVRNSERIEQDNISTATTSNTIRSSKSANYRKSTEITGVRSQGDSYSSSSSSRSIKSIHRTIYGGVEKSKISSNAGINRETNNSDRISVSQDTSNKRNLLADSRQNFTISSRNSPDTKVIASATATKITSAIKFSGIEELATSVSNFSTEQNLETQLSQLNDSLNQIEHDFTTAVRQQKLASLDAALNQWQLGNKLAGEILDLKQIQFDFQEMSESIIEWQTSENLVSGLTTLQDFVTAIDSEQKPLHQNLKLQTEELVKVLNQLHLQTDLAPTLLKLTQLLKEVQSIDRGRQPNSKLPNKTVSDSQFEFDLKNLAIEVAEQQATETINSKLAILNEAVELAKVSISKRLENINWEIIPQTSKIDQTLGRLSEKGLIAKSPFWNQENYSKFKRPQHIEKHHWKEFSQSAIHPDLIGINAQSLKGDEVLQQLLEQKLATMGSGQYVTVPMGRELRKYESVAEGGWWGEAGIDALSLVNLTPGEKPNYTDWGCFKPDNPRIDKVKTYPSTQNIEPDRAEIKYRKYENPAKARRVPFLINVPDDLAEKIYRRYQIDPTPQERQSGFWYVVKQYSQIPITITEGFKKTLSSFSQGYVTIGLTGVNHIYRSTDEDKNKLPARELNPEVAVFATPDREFRFAYDQDTKVKSILNVRRDLVRGVELLEARGSNCRILKWDSQQGKGLDDLIANKGASAYDDAQRDAIIPAKDQQIHYRTEYNKLAKKTLVEFGQLDNLQKDLEIYTRAVLKGEKADGTRILQQSDRYRQLIHQNPQQAQDYIESIAAIAGTYKRLQSAQTKNLDSWAERLVNSYLIKKRSEIVLPSTSIVLNKNKHTL